MTGQPANGGKPRSSRSQKKKFFNPHGLSKSAIEYRTSGILVSCAQSKEQKAAAEIKLWFKEIADELYGPEDVTDKIDLSDTADGDIEEALKAELDGLKKDRKEWRFQQVNLKSDSLIYFKTIPPVVPTEVVTKLIESVLTTGTKNCRHCIRIVPVQETCYASVEDMSKVVAKLAKPILDIDGDLTVIRWALVAKVRSNSSMNSDTLLKAIPPLIPSRHKVDLTNPEVTVLIEIIKNVACISVLRDYNRYKKYNVRSIWDDLHPDTKRAIEESKAAKILARAVEKKAIGEGKAVSGEGSNVDPREEMEESVETSVNGQNATADAGKSKDESIEAAVDGQNDSKKRPLESEDADESKQSKVLRAE
ncbi:hypothetical protein SeMB42_g01716 [Synchytrium endobioticum]|uniref:THUMP domain-containing protein n=1 Tax=Synchytrium endobioticum TaxID=286115 RepID=A0A507DK54_9FUNG|nr:hypothetical protein SeLEV6574_g03893 [Synchytrium endobioticum]TPX52003.1 hypothetical protein SeMB42_g01716 [Synchytrium endobioticum]